MGVACFADEAGAYRACSRLCVAVVCFETGGYGVYRAGWGVYTLVRRLLGWSRGELKYRGVSRAARRRGIGIHAIVESIVSGALSWGCAAAHLESVVELAVVKERLLVEAGRAAAGASILVVDEGLVAGDSSLARVRRGLGVARVRFGDSRRFTGIQLADIVAGYCAERGSLQGGTCS